MARATSGSKFYETIGFNIAVKKVLGASTLPVYSQPENQFVYTTDGASFRIVTCFKIWLEKMFEGPSQMRDFSGEKRKVPLLRMIVWLQEYLLFAARNVMFYAASKPQFSSFGV